MNTTIMNDNAIYDFDTNIDMDLYNRFRDISENMVFVNDINYDFSIRSRSSFDSINYAYESFLLWLNDIMKFNKIDILASEKELLCEYFGGTCDLLIRIDDKSYLVDFKTSNHVSYRYYLQMSAYTYILKTEYGINIDGYIILQLDKNSVSYEEYIIDFSNKAHYDFNEECTNCYLSLVHSYYMRKNVELKYNTI